MMFLHYFAEEGIYERNKNARPRNKGSPMNKKVRNHALDQAFDKEKKKFQQNV